MDVIDDKQNDLLNRREVKVVVESSKNPSMEEAEKLIADKFKVGEGAVSIKKINSKFGRNTFLIVANIYKNKEDKDKIEPKTKKQLEAEKKAEEEKKAAEEKAAEQPAEKAEQPKEEQPAAEQKPVEQPKEEKPSENKEENKKQE